jgi:hypothetical protein
VSLPRRAALACLLTVACTDPLLPSHAPVYLFTDTFGDVFHWPADRLPVRFYAEPRGNLPALLRRAVEVWERQFLYGEFRGELVQDSSAADVIVRWEDSVPLDVPPDNGPPVNACGGVTQAFLDTLGTSFVGPFETQIRIVFDSTFTPGQIQACVARTTIHEMGHALGLLREAPDSLQDIMFSPPLVSLPGTRDRNTIQALYHTPATLGPPPR